MANETTLGAKVVLDPSGIAPIAPAFNRATQGAREFEQQVTRTEGSVKRLGQAAKGGAFGQGGFFSRGASGAGLQAISALSQFSTAEGSSAQNITAGVGVAGAAAFAIPGIGAAIGAALIAFAPKIGEAIAKAFNLTVKPIDTAGFTAEESRAAARIDTERRDGGNLDDAGSILDKQLVEQAQSRVLQEQMLKALQELKASRQIELKTYIEMMEKYGKGQDILAQQQREIQSITIIGGAH